jgi:hypothetical protein
MATNNCPTFEELMKAFTTQARPEHGWMVTFETDYMGLAGIYPAKCTGLRADRYDGEASVFLFTAGQLAGQLHFETVMYAADEGIAWLVTPNKTTQVYGPKE